MRLIRSVRHPANIGLFREFQRCQVNKTLSAHSHTVLIEASNLVHGSNIPWRGRSYAASTSSDAIEARKPRRRVSKNERKSMVENYVKKYRETNAGKFPTVSDAVKDVGGSYYLVRQILQELIYNSKQSSVETKETSLVNSAVEKYEISSNIGEVSESRELGEAIRPILKEDIGNSNSKIIESKQGKQSSILVENDKSKEVGSQCHRMIDKPESGLHPDPEKNIKQEKLEDKQKVDGLKANSGSQESTEISRRESHEVPAGDADAEPQKKSSMWNNLKSFANEILSMWKRS